MSATTIAWRSWCRGPSRCRSTCRGDSRRAGAYSGSVARCGSATCSAPRRSMASTVARSSTTCWPMNPTRASRSAEAGSRSTRCGRRGSIRPGALDPAASWRSTSCSAGRRSTAMGRGSRRPWHPGWAPRCAPSCSRTSVASLGPPGRWSGARGRRGAGPRRSSWRSCSGRWGPRSRAIRSSRCGCGRRRRRCSAAKSRWRR